MSPAEPERGCDDKRSLELGNPERRHLHEGPGLPRTPVHGVSLGVLCRDRDPTILVGPFYGPAKYSDWCAAETSPSPARHIPPAWLFGIRTHSVTHGTAGLGFGGGCSCRISPERARARTHLVDEAGELGVEGLDLLLLLTADFVFQRVDPDTKGLQQPLVDADALDAIGFAIGVTPHDAKSPGAAEADPSSGGTVAYAPEAELSKTSRAAGPVHVGNSPASPQVADAPAAVGAGPAAPGLAGGGGVAAAADLRSRTEAAPSQDGSHRRRLSAHRGSFEGGMWTFKGSSSAGEGTEAPLK